MSTIDARALVLLALMTAPLAALAGCAAAPAEPSARSSAEPGAAGDRAVDATVAAADGRTPGPWPDGRWVGYRVTSSSLASGPVIAVVRGGLFLADSRYWAVEEATRDVPLLGALDAGTLAGTAFGGRWDVLQLPLTDGERWTTTVRLPDEVGALAEVELVLTARAAPVFTPTRQEEGFLVEGRAGDRLALETSYSPSMHLPTFVRVFGPSGNVTWQAVASAEGHDWDGPAWSATAKVLVDAWTLTAPHDQLLGPPTVGAPVVEDFEAAAPGERVFGYLVAVAFGGAQDVSLVAPSGRRLAASATGATWDVAVVDEPTQAGRWQVAAAGAGAVAFAGVWLWSVAVTEISPSVAG